MESDNKEDNLDIKQIDEQETEALNNNIVKQKPCKTELDTNTEICKSKPEESYINIFLLVCIVGVSMGVLLEIINVLNRTHKFDQHVHPERLKYWVYSNSSMAQVNNKNGILKHVHLVLERLGYEKSTNETPWSLLWAHTHPFVNLDLHNLSANQLVNHVPGTAHITCKVILATLQSKYIPKAFKLPKNKKEFLTYAEQNKNALFLQKNNFHRHVYLKNVSEVDVDSGSSFVQEYMQKPFLVDGHKFDIGVYVVLESVDPLRVYWYKGDVLFRYCPSKYYPFDPKNLDKYVIGDDYLPTWEVPSLAHPYTALGNSMKEAFDIYVRSVGKDPTQMWEDVQKAIAEVFIKQEHLIVKKVKEYSSTDNFFEMMRFDLIVDEDLRVYLLEANMGPNLSSNHYPPNQLLYEQVLYNLFSLTGVARANVAGVNSQDTQATADMISAQKNIAVFGDECRTICKESCDAMDLCHLCKPCLSAKMKKTFLAAHSEFLHRGDFRRLIPPPMVPKKDIKSLADMKNITFTNKLLHLWYQGKCNQDVTWCT